MLLACRGGKKNLAAYDRKAVFYFHDEIFRKLNLIVYRRFFGNVVFSCGAIVEGDI
jgi:hypothetical protein